MMDYIRQLRVAGRRSWTQVGTGGSSRLGRRRASCALTGWEPLERRELLSTVQNFEGGTGQTAYTKLRVAGLPAAQVMSGGPTGNFLRLATTPTAPTASVPGNDNSISFVTSDPGSYNQATASWDFRVTPQTGNGDGMSFALLNTSDYGSSGGAYSSAPQQGLYKGSLAFGFDTAADAVNLSFNDAIVTTTSLLGQLNLANASGQFITANAAIDFLNARVSLSLTYTIPATVSTPAETVTVPVFGSTTVPGLAPYESRVSLEAKNDNPQYPPTLTSADFDLDNINVQMGTIHFGIQFESPTYTAQENQRFVQISIVRSGSMNDAATVSYVTADGTAKNGVNYTAVASTLTFGEGQALQTFTVPIIDAGLSTGGETVKLFIGNNPTFAAPLGSPIVATLRIVNNDSPPTVSPKVQFLYAPHTRRVTAFRLQFSQPMDPTSAQTVSNYEVLLPPAHKNGPVRVVSLSQAVLDPSGLFVTLYRASLGQHLTNLFQIVVRGKPPTGLTGTNGTFLAGTGGVSGTDAVLTVSV